MYLLDCGAHGIPPSVACVPSALESLVEHQGPVGKEETESDDQQRRTKGPHVHLGIIGLRDEHLWRSVPTSCHVACEVGARVHALHSAGKAKVTEPHSVCVTDEHILWLDISVQHLQPVLLQCRR